MASRRAAGWLLWGMLGAALPAAAGGPLAPALDSPSFASAVAERGAAEGQFLSVAEALSLALQRGFDAELARAEPARAEEAMRGARGMFDPRLTAGVSLEREQPVGLGAAAGAGSAEQRGLNYTTGVEGLLPLGLRYDSRYEWSMSEPAGAARSASARWSAELALPLLRGRGGSEARGQLRAGELGMSASREAFGARVAQIALDVELLYWDASAARAGAQRAEQSRRAAEALLEQTRELESAGVLSRQSLLEAELGVGERALASRQARLRAEVARGRLLDAIGAAGAPERAGRSWEPEPPSFRAYPVALDAALARALRQRPELAEARRQLELAQGEDAAAADRARPRFDLVARYTRELRDPLGRAPGCAGGQGEACGEPRAAALELGQRGGAEGSRGVAFSAQLELPLGNRAARAEQEQRSIEARRRRTALRQLEQRVGREVREAVRQLDFAARSAEAARERQVTSAEFLEMERARLELGESTPFRVLEAEEKLADAELAQIEALRDHRGAIARVEQAQGTLLERRGLRAAADPDAGN